MEQRGKGMQMKKRENGWANGKDNLPFDKILQALAYRPSIAVGLASLGA